MMSGKAPLSFEGALLIILAAKIKHYVQLQSEHDAAAFRRRVSDGSGETITLAHKSDSEMDSLSDMIDQILPPE